MSRLSSERLAVARDIIGRYPVARSALIPLIHLAQEQDGYVTDDAMEHIAELVGCTAAEVYGTASFYEMFKFHPVGKYVVGVCTNISCLLQGAEELLEHAESSLGVRTGGTTADGQFTLEDVECIAACTLAPCIQVNYRYFPNVTPEGFDGLVGDLRSGALDQVVPPHGTLARVRQEIPAARWASSGTSTPRLPDTFPNPALGGGQSGAHGTDSTANEPAGADAGQVRHGAAIGDAVDARPDQAGTPGSASATSGSSPNSPAPGAPETGAARPATDRPGGAPSPDAGTTPPSPGADETR